MIEETNSIYVLKCKKEGMQTHLSGRLRGAVGQESERQMNLNQEHIKTRGWGQMDSQKPDIWEAGDS